MSIIIVNNQFLYKDQMLALENNNSEPIYYKAPLDGLYTVVEHTKLYKVYYVNEQDWDDSASYYIMKDEVSV